MPRGPKKHLKPLAALRSWKLGKLGRVFTVKPSSGPHKQGESLPISLFLR
jgi:small subunit ribosomal protein S4e